MNITFTSQEVMHLLSALRNQACEAEMAIDEEMDGTSGHESALEYHAETHDLYKKVYRTVGLVEAEQDAATFLAEFKELIEAI